MRLRYVVLAIAAIFSLSACSSGSTTSSDADLKNKISALENEVASLKKENKKLEEKVNLAETNSSKNEVAQSASKTESTSDESYTTYSSELFSIDYPKGWDEIDASRFNTPLLKFAVKNDNLEKMFSENINVTVQKNSPFLKTSVDDIVDETVNYFISSGEEQAGIKDFKKTNFKPKKFGNSEAGILTGSYKHVETGNDIVLTQYFVPTDSIILTVSITFTQSFYDEQGKDIIDHVFESLVIPD
ncbi:cell division protein FtsB [Fontibacillus solani]|uniref:Cell division protein FtsB n=1 Tax=Fontibacillus solani TaxID=1572857 RepID=A0A7W3SY17_9BACL|nr:hypothetical protein [Fontibacillus solani]MBA9088336.1 cell division protein FtsB [Fontibacillus solani]